MTRNGTRVLSGSGVLPAPVHRSSGYPHLCRQARRRIDQQWTLTYTPEQSLQINSAIPGGTLDFAGTLDWTRGTEHYVLTVTTPTPLHYNNGCTDTVQRFDSGEMRLTGTFADPDGGERNGSVVVRWNGVGGSLASASSPKLQEL